MATQILQGNLILPDQVLERGQIVVDDGIIHEVRQVGSAGAPTSDFGEQFIAPGFIDLHTHGVAGVDTMDGTRDALDIMARRYAAHGVTGFLPTTMTESVDLTVRAIRAVRDYRQAQEGREPRGAQVLGMHLEGPWISAQYKGAQSERHILAPDESTARTFLEAAEGVITIVTLAPEGEGADSIICLLREQGICVSIGHSGATHDQAVHAMGLGASHVTHCFNAMTGLHHRAPGIVGAALLEDLFAELIADGIHVHPAAMRLLIRVKGRERVMLITDSMAAAEMPDGTYALGGQDVFVRGGEARLHDGTLAGSTLVLDQAVRNVVQLCDVPLVDAVYMATAVPAAAIGLDSSKGQIRPGCDADLVILDRDLQPRAVLIGGTACRS